MKDNSILHEFVNTLKENGFKVYTSAGDENYSYCHFVKDNKIGYVQTDYFGGLTFSTVHIPNKNTGTGFGLNNINNRVFNPTIEDAEEAFMIAPNWATYEQRNSVVKYESWENYLSKPVNQILKQIEL